MIKGIFFDLDGTLVDTHEANYQAYKKALADFSVAITFADFKATIGHQAQTFLPKLAPGLAPPDYQAIAEHKAAYYKELMHLTKLNERLVQFLEYVAPNHATVLVTTAKPANAHGVLGHHSLAGYFDHIITSADVTHSKPSPEAYELALQKTGLQPSEAIAFEDSLTGQQSAEAAGIAVVLVNDFAI